MARGIIYAMTTAIDGLIKIGKTNDFKNRMTLLEQNGYRNATGLKRAFAIEVEDYDSKEVLLHTLFEKSRASDTELFSVDINLVIQLLTSFEGNIIYPVNETKKEIFDEATENSSSLLIPDGTYTLERKKKSTGETIKAIATVVNGNWTILKGSTFSLQSSISPSSPKVEAFREKAKLDSSGKLLQDFNVGIHSPSFTSNLVLYAVSNGWEEWKNERGQRIDVYRKKA